jgi:peptidoglycan/xylan/chitin deacetylase (PgdA/CDA1 family)
MINNPVPWPNGARCAVAITFDIDTDSILHLEYPDRAEELMASMSWLKYDEIAIPRILEMYRRYGIKQTFFYPAWCMEHYPHLVEMILKDGHEIAAHGYLHENPNQMSRERQEYWLDKQIEVIERMTGQKPRGWRGPLYNASKDSPVLLAERGMLYDATLMGDDIPYVLDTGKGEVICLPSHWAMDDWPHYTHSMDFHYMMPIKAPDEAMKVFTSEFEAMWKHRGMLVTVWHPFVSGRLARLDRVAEWIEYMQAKGEVWFATMDEIARHVRTMIDEGTWTPRVDRLPYYGGRIAEYEEEAAEAAE